MNTVLRIVVSIVGVLVTLMGIGWFLQGINVLPGSFMTGQPQWAVYGVFAVMIGVALVVVANRGRGKGK